MLCFLKEIIDNEKGLYHQLYISLLIMLLRVSKPENVRNRIKLYLPAGS